MPVFFALLPTGLSAGELLRDVLDITLTGFGVYTPVYAPAGEIVDFTFLS